MPDQVPSIGVAATRDAITITLPTDPDTSLPRIPDELLGEDIPSFVAEWILESDEIGVLIQELLQAPTASLCRIFEVPTGPSSMTSGSLSGFQFGSPTVTRPVFRPPSFSTMTSFETSGFDAGAGALEDMPAGVQLPGRLLELCSIAARVEAWIEKGYRVRDWAEEHGHGDASWLPAAG